MDAIRDDDRLSPDQTAAPTFADLLGPLPEPVYGTRVRPEDFRLVDGEWCAELELDGRRRDVRLRMMGTHAWCSVDGEPLLYPDPYRKTETDRGAYPLEWFEHLCRWEVRSRPRAGRPWEGDSTEAMLTRVEQGIVAYDEHERAACDLRGVAGAQEWLDQALATTQVRVTAYALVDFPLYPDGTEIGPGRMLCTVRDGEVVGYWAYPVATDLDPGAWFGEPGREQRAHPSVTVRTSGPEVLGVEADHVLLADDVDERHVDARWTCDEPSYRPWPDWMVIHVHGTRCLLPVPVAAANLCVDVDGDGSQVTISIASNARRERHLQLRDRFERRWGHFLDDDHALTEAELDAAVAQVESQVRADLAQEQHEHEHDDPEGSHDHAH